MRLNLRLGSVAITDIHTWRQDLWEAGWIVRRMIPRRGIFGWKLLLWRRGELFADGFVPYRGLCRRCGHAGMLNTQGECTYHAPHTQDAQTTASVATTTTAG